MKFFTTKKFLAFVFALAFLVGAVTNAAWAELWIGETQVTDTVTSGTDWQYYADSRTLKLFNFTYEGEGHSTGNCNAAIYCTDTTTNALTIELYGTNKITQIGAGDASGNNYGIYSNPKLTIRGVDGGTLDVTSGTTTNSASYGIYAHYTNSDIEITDSAKVTATGGTGNSSFGIYANHGSIRIDQTAKVTATGGTAGYDSYGLYAEGDIEILNNAALTATGGTITGDSDQKSYGIYSGKSEGNSQLRINSSVKYVIASGNTSAFNDKINVSNGVEGSGWDNTAGTGNATSISTLDSQTLNYKKVKFPVTIHYGLWIGETEVTEANLSGTGWEYDADTNTLKLKDGFNFSGKGHSDGNLAGMYYSGNDTLIIEISGTASLELNDSESNVAAGICCSIGSLQIKGSGTFNVTNTNNATGNIYRNADIYAHGGIEIGGNVNLKISSSAPNASVSISNGIFAPTSSIAIIENAQVEATASKAEVSYGIQTNQILIVQQSAKLTATGGEGSSASYGIRANNVNIGGSITVTATGGTTTGTEGSTPGITPGDSYGIFAKIMRITGGTVLAVSGSGTYTNGYGIGYEDTNDNNVFGTLTVGAGITSVTVQGSTKAFYNDNFTVTNAIKGKGYSGENIEDIDISETARTLTNYQKVEFIKYYTVTFESNEGTSVDSQSIVSGEKAEKPSDPTRSGYKFGGWCKDEALSTLWNFDSDTVTEDITIYAWWMEIPSATVSPSGAGFVIFDEDAENRLWKLTATANSGFTFAKWTYKYHDASYEEASSNIFTISYPVVGSTTPYSDVVANFTSDSDPVPSGGKTTPTVTKPTAKSLTYNGSAQELVNAGSTTGGTLQYALGTATGPTTEYSTSIPTATEAGTYYVWYRVVGNENYNDVAAASVKVIIKEYDDNVITTADNLEKMSDEEKQAIKTLTLTSLEDLTKIDYTQLTNLTTMKISETADVDTVDLSQLPATVQTFSFSKNNYVQTLTLEGSKVKNIEATSCDSLVSVDLAGNNYIESLDVSGSTKLAALNASN
ncbi:MAG: InlB B-repeat-containing protein [Synergistaceae bacterium]|nr:InlB B-repeat-containing protein [Synergistaceae bacterium]